MDFIRVYAVVKTIQDKSKQVELSEMNKNELKRVNTSKYKLKWIIKSQFDSK